MAFEEDSYSNVQVLYQLSRQGKLEHPHMITVQYPSDQDGLRLRDVKKQLAMLRGQGIGHSFSWSYKRNYKSTFIWNDLSDDDVIHPLRGSGEYVLKASELIDAFANKAAENLSKYKNERTQSSLTSHISKSCRLDQSNQAVGRHSRTMSVDNLAVGAGRSDNLKEDESTKGVAIDSPQNLAPLSVEQETIDVEKSDLCVSSSDNEISPRPMKMADIKPAKDQVLVVMTRSSRVQGLQTPPSYSRVTSPTEAPFSPGSAKRFWKREIRKSLFGTRNTNASPPSQRQEIVSQNVWENAHLHAEASPVENFLEDALFWRDGRSKSVSTLGLDEMKEKEKEKEKEVEQSTSQLIRLLWARWTGGSSRLKRIPNSTCEASSTSHPCEAAKTPETKPNPRSDLCQSHTKSPCKERRSPTHVDRKEISPQEELALLPASKALRCTDNPASEEISAVNTSSHDSPQPGTQELRTQQPILSKPNLQVVLDNPATDTQRGPPEAEVDTPKPVIARADFKSVKNSNGLARVKTSTTSTQSLPPGFHKGTNDTKPVQTPRRSPRSTIPLASPPLRRCLSKDATRSFSGNIGAITESPEQDSVTSTSSHEIKKCIDFRERDERRLTPGLTTLDWEKALQEAATDCLPPSNFREILQECSTCGRTFKPDSLQVHMRACHPPQYARAVSVRVSPHMLRS